MQQLCKLLKKKPSKNYSNENYCFFRQDFKNIIPSVL